MIVAKGLVAAQPFARTVFSLAAKRFTGDLILTASRREYRWSMEGGQIVAAMSPSPADTPGRVALANGLVNSSTLGQVVKLLAEQPNRDPFDAVAEVAKLNEDQRTNLKRRVLSRAAARLFALPDAEFVVDNARTMRADATVPALDIRWLIYFGLRTHYSIERLNKELAAIGDRAIQMPQEALRMLPAFGFGDIEAPVLKRLQTQSLSLANLVAHTPEVDRAAITCIVYALMACGYLSLGDPQSPPAPSPSHEPRTPRPTATQSAAAARAPRPQPRPSSSPNRSGPSTSPIARSTLQGSSSFVKAPGGTLQGSGFIDPHAPASAPASGPNQPKTAEAATITTVIASKLALLDSDANHYSLLGIEQGASEAGLRSAYFDLAKKLHPDRLHAIGMKAQTQDAQRLFAAINKAFAVLSNPKERHQYGKVLAAGGEKAYRKSQQAAEDLAMKTLAAEEHFHLGEMALRRDQFATAEREFAQAKDLSPDESEYLALYAWAFYCNASDRISAESEAMKYMSSALLKGPKSLTTRLYHAKLLKLLGRGEESIASFRKVLELNPGNREAELELRLLSKRNKSATEAKKGLFGRKKS